MDLVAGASKRTACVFGESLTLRFLAKVLLSIACVSPLVFEATTGVVEGSAMEVGLLPLGELAAQVEGFIDDRRMFAFGLMRLLGRGMSEIGREVDILSAGADLGICGGTGKSSSTSGSSGKLSQLLALAVLRRFFCIAM
jgi:hypothetical protein